MMDESRLRIGWDIFRVFEAFDVIRCFNCSDYHHLSKNCTSKKRCLKCSKKHGMSECESTVEFCCNCSETAKSLKLDLYTNHSAMSSDCPVYLRKINAQRQRTNYSHQQPISSVAPGNFNSTLLTSSIDVDFALISSSDPTHNILVENCTTINFRGLHRYM